jgi:hypothetical protein
VAPFNPRFSDTVYLGRDAAERKFKIRGGLEALEQRFDACGLEYWVPGRVSAV